VSHGAFGTNSLQGGSALLPHLTPRDRNRSPVVHYVRAVRRSERTAPPLFRAAILAENPLAHAIPECEPNDQSDCRFQHQG